MTTVSDIYGSGEGGKFLKATDLQKRAVKVEIESWAVQEFDERDKGKKRKIVLRFVGKEKSFVVNVTNATAIEYAFGPDPDDWVGKTIELYTTMVSFGDDMVEAIRVRAINPDQMEMEEIPF